MICFSGELQTWEVNSGSISSTVSPNNFVVESVKRIKNMCNLEISNGWPAGT